MKKPKRLILLFIILILSQLAAIGTKIYIKSNNIIIPTSAIPQGFLFIFSTILGIASVILCIYCFKRIDKARVLLFFTICLKSALGLLATLTTDFEKFRTEHPNLATGENFLLELIMIGLTLALYYWMIYSNKTNLYFRS